MSTFKNNESNLVTDPQNRGVYTFSLSGINMEKIDKLLNNSIIHTIDDKIPSQTTKLVDLEFDKKGPEILSFISESKNIHKCSIAQVDFTKKKYKCFWDRNYIPQDWLPIGCPLKYIPSKVTKVYHSQISKEKYKISEYVTEDRRTEIELKKDSDAKYITEKNNYYETDGIFCSFNCCLAFLESLGNRKNPIYKNSKSLLFQIYTDITNGGNPLDVIPAPHWRLLEDFGGHLSIDQFRESFNKIKYTNRGTIIFKSIGILFEDQIKF